MTSLTRLHYTELDPELQEQLAQLRLALRHYLPGDVNGVQITLDELRDPDAVAIISTLDLRVI